MKSHITARFRQAFTRLPDPIQRQTRIAYKLFIQNPYHPSLHFKQIHPTRPIYSARVSLGFRAVGVRHGGEIIWFWIGSHDEYERLIANL